MQPTMQLPAVSSSQEPLGGPGRVTDGTMLYAATAACQPASRSLLQLLSWKKLQPGVWHPCQFAIVVASRFMGTDCSGRVPTTRAARAIERAHFWRDALTEGPRTICRAATVCPHPVAGGPLTYRGSERIGRIAVQHVRVDGLAVKVAL